MVWGWAAFCSESPRLILIFFAAEKNGPPAVVVAATRSASDSNFRSGKGEWFRLQNAATPRLHRFLISGSNLGIDARFCLFTLSCVHRFLISGSDLRIDASFSLFTLFCASILDFRVKLGNRCKLFPVYPSFVHRFLISGSNLGIDARFCLFMPSSVHRFLISGSDLRIDARFCLFTPSFVHRFLISSPDLGIDAASSLLQLRIARLQHHRSCAEERPSCRMTVADAGRDRMPRRRHNPK